MKKPIVLAILDGYGLREETHGNAVALAKKPIFTELWNTYPHTTLTASGQLVGLPKGQMGNSEVGHMNIGAGRIVYHCILPLAKLSVYPNHETYSPLYTGAVSYTHLTLLLMKMRQLQVTK